MFDTIETPVAPRRKAVKITAHANSVRSGINVAPPVPGASNPNATASCTADLAKKMINKEFQPMIDTACRAAGTTQPRDPNCGLVAATESIPKRTQAGPAAISTSSMPMKQPAVSAIAPCMKPK